ncbi:hypothetical protein Vadar_030820 [Vaccinium darrowii]|uniref:Uncharacterized protein n=1 Tax=Vaccinium darrowii TaxID=229202 RepID=A0ACB7XUC8_9ERIC|nr:hypothetical protein Vadar_030820 [Vaccinium darrowii]
MSDNVLHHIISFLSTEDSIRTSILSRRWQYLWTSISDINLDVNSYSSGKRNDTDKKNDQCPMGQTFLDFVDRVLHLHDSSDIKRLYLNIDGPVSSSRLSSWISAAVRHNVQELDLNLPGRTQFLLPFYFLKTLAFDSLTFFDDESTQNLFSNCPVLEELTLKYCGWKNIKTLAISIPTLKRLTIEDDPLWSDAADGLSCVVTIYTPNLIDLKFTNVYPRVIGVLRGICNVECLTLSEDTLLSILDVENTMECLPTFRNMTDLELNAEFRGSFTEILINLFEKSPQLEFLDFAWGFDPDDIHDHNVDLMLARVPSCCSVKEFSLSCFEGKPTEMHFLKFLLKNATLLESMTLYSGPVLSEDLEKEVEVKNQLRAFPRGSESCTIELL